MNYLLIDAINCLIIKENDNLSLNSELLTYLETRPESKILATNAKEEILAKIKELMQNTSFEVFSLEFNPEKTDPKYFEIILERFKLKSKDCFYIDHSQLNLDSAKKVGISGVLYENNEQAIVMLDLN